MRNSTIVNLSRRNFFGASGVFVLGVTLSDRATSAASLQANEQSFQPNLFVQISSNDQVTITSHRSEMGQGVRTAVAQVVADELEANWDKVNVAQAPGDPAYGDQNTDGSRSMLAFFESLREAGAKARKMLTQAAASEWQVPYSECSASNGSVIHKPTKRSLSFGVLAGAASKLEVPSSAEKKSRSDFRFIGHPMTHVDARDIAMGQAAYGADVRLENMVYAVVVRCPHLGGGIKSVSHKGRSIDLTSGSAKSVFTGRPSNDDVASLEILEPVRGPIMFNPVGGVAVVANDTWTAISIARSLDIGWTNGQNESFSSDTFDAAMKDAVNKPASSLFSIGDIDKAFADADKVVEATFETPFLSHAPMEPPAAIADVTQDRVKVRAPVQDPQGTRNSIAQWLGRPPNQIEVIPTLLGGAFGRKSKPDFVLEAVELSKRLERPVRVQWTREDDIHHDYFHAANMQYFKASLDSDGQTTGLLQRTIFPTIGSTFSPLANSPQGFELEMGFTNTPYRFPNQRMEAGSVRAGVRIGWLRSVCNIFHAFGANVFIDELAHAANQDPIDYRMSMWPKTGKLQQPGQPAPPGHELDYARLRATLQTVRSLSDWDRKRSEGKALGVAIHHSFRSYVATVIEVSDSDGIPRVDKAFVALDCGTYVNPDTCIAQMEGAVIFGLSLAQKSRITVKDGAVEQNNFDGYQVLRMAEAPDIAVELINSTALPAGVGEPGVPPIAPALSNAVFSLNGVRHRKLPIA